MLPKRPYIIGFDIGGTRLRICLSKGKTILADSSAIVPYLGYGAAEVKFVINQAEKLLESFGIPRNEVGYLSVATAALIDSSSGTVESWPNRPYWRGISFLALLRNSFQAHIMFEDDANAAAYGEWIYGCGRKYTSLAYLTISTGIGSGLILGRKLYKGEKGWAGEIGHTTVVLEGPLCSCGKYGCLQAVASGKAIAQRWIEHLKPAVDACQHNDEIDSTYVALRAMQGDPIAVEIFREAASYVGASIANLINILDLSVVIVGGGVIQAKDVFLVPLKERVKKETSNIRSRNVEILESALGDKAGAVGAIALALNNL